MSLNVNYILRTKCDVCNKPNKCLMLSRTGNEPVLICEYCLTHHTVTLQAVQRTLPYALTSVEELDNDSV